MARMAWCEDEIVTNFYEIKPEQISEFEQPGLQIAEVGRYSVQIGDEYRDGKFWRDGEPLHLPADIPEPEVPTDGLSEDAAAALEMFGVQVYE